MSFSNQNIRLDQLPDQRIFNPLRGNQKGRGSVKKSAPQQTGKQQQQQRPAGLFGRIAAPPPKRVLDDLSDSADEDELSADEAPAARYAARPVGGNLLESTIASGPFAKVADTNQCSFQFIAAFKDVSGSLSKNSASVVIQFSEVLRHADTPNFSKYDPRRTIPIYVRVAGTSLSDEHRRLCSLEVYDAAGKPLYSKHVHKHNNSEVATATGYPLFLFSQGAQNNILYHPPELSSDHKTYWTFTMETLEKNTSMFSNPTTGEQYVIIKKDSGCAKLMQYALSERNDIVRNPWLLENPAYQNPNDTDNIRLPVDLYNKVKSAYRKKLGEIAATSFDLSSIKVVLKPLELAKEMWNEHARSPESSAAVPNVNHVWGHVAIEVLAHIPSLEEEGGAPSERRSQAPRRDEEEDSDEEL